MTYGLNEKTRKAFSSAGFRDVLAERAGFEPALGINLNTLSRLEILSLSNALNKRLSGRYHVAKKNYGHTLVTLEGGNGNDSAAC